LLSRQFNEIRSLALTPLETDFASFVMNRMRFNELGIPYYEVNQIQDCHQVYHIYFSNTKLCID